MAAGIDTTKQEEWGGEEGRRTVWPVVFCVGMINPLPSPLSSLQHNIKYTHQHKHNTNTRERKRGEAKLVLGL